MKLTTSLRHAKYFWWGKGWGHKPRKNTDSFYYKMQWNAKRRRQLELIQQTLPEGVKPIDPNVYLKADLNEELRGERMGKFKLPWPYSVRPVKGTPEDPKYKSTALVYNRQKRLVEPINLPLNFTNSILHSTLPPHVEAIREKIRIDSQVIEYFRRRVAWCLKNDAQMRRLPIDRQFPYLDQKPPRTWGVTVNRKEASLLLTLFDFTAQYARETYGLNANMIVQRVSSPNCVLPLDRNASRLTILDLECDFFTLLAPINQNATNSKSMILFDSHATKTTSDVELASIHPISWELAFDEKNIYEDDYEFLLPRNASIHTIYLSNNNVRMLGDQDFQGRAIMFCYGYAVQQAKLLHPNFEKVEQIQLDRPMCVQCVFTNPRNFTVGIVFFQLNTLKPNDRNVRNQVWFIEPKSVTDDSETILANLVLSHSLGLYH